MTLLCGFAELYQVDWQKPTLSEEEAYNGVPYKYDELRGWALGKNIKVRSTLFLGKELIYDIYYTTNQYGLRVAPHDLNPSLNPQKAFNNVVFFVCSFVLGEGVNDNETLPYFFEKKSGGDYRSYNLAGEGYGPHQMLRMLETGFLETVIPDKKPSIAIYLCLSDHIERSSCKYPYFMWGITGPKYKLNSSGEVQYVGKFNDSLISKVKFKLFNQLAKSLLLSNNYWAKQLLNWNIAQDDKELFIKIILRSKEIFTERYGGKFYVILWTDKSVNYPYILSELKKYQIPVITTEEIFHKFNDPMELYRIKADGHPSKIAYERIADYIQDYLKKTP